MVHIKKILQSHFTHLISYLINHFRIKNHKPASDLSAILQILTCKSCMGSFFFTFYFQLYPHCTIDTMGSVLILDSSVGLRLGSFAINQCMNDELERFSQFFSLSTSSLPGHWGHCTWPILISFEQVQLLFSAICGPHCQKVSDVVDFAKD